MSALMWVREHARLLVVALVGMALFAAGYGLRDLQADRDAAIVETTAAKQDATVARGAVVAVEGVRADEHRQAEAVVAVSAEYQKGLEDGKKEQKAALARLNTVIGRLRQQSATGRDVGVPEAGACAGGRDGETQADFLAAHGADLIRLAGEADDVAKQLAAAQGVIGEYQRMDGGKDLPVINDADQKADQATPKSPKK